uniref:Putative ovule protein n=1 Tax=Solanum chacoense TaxID=4108 RepID=A0A0V0GYX9_SOLCH
MTQLINSFTCSLDSIRNFQDHHFFNLHALTRKKCPKTTLTYEQDKGQRCKTHTYEESSHALKCHPIGLPIFSISIDPTLFA